MISSLDRKLFRDIWDMKGQVIAIALVIAAGVCMFVMYLSNFDSLRRTQNAYYERYRFGDVFCGLKRGPARLIDRIAAIPGVAQVAIRVVADVTIDVEGLEEPATGRLISIPATGRPKLNDIFLRSGRWIEQGRPDEVVVNEAFALAHKLVPGDSVAAVINGRRRNLTIVGLGLSPEYVYRIRPGEIIPDDRRFGIFWMERKALASAFDMEGGFNDVTLRLMRGASPDEAIVSLDRILDTYGGFGAIPRRLQLSHWTLDSELTQLQNFGFAFPLIFLGVAAFLLNVVLTRTLSIQRPQIAALKALGYSNAELAWHYIKWALIITFLGIAIGVASGSWLGSGLIAMYNDYFRFPVLEYQLSIGVAVAAFFLSIGSAILGARSAVRRAVRIPPAEAMRPEPPTEFRMSVFEKMVLSRWLTNAGRLVVRNLFRQPFRALTSIVGIAFSAAILVVGLFFLDSMDLLIDTQFYVAQRQDATLTFTEPVSARALYEVGSLPGVMSAEPYRAVPARIRAGHRYRYIAIRGLEASPRLNRVIDRNGRVVRLPADGLVLSKTLADVLAVNVGDALQIEILEGARPVRTAVVADLVDEYMGLSVYMEIGALRRLMREGGSLSGAYLQVDEADLNRLYRRLKATPAVASVNLTRFSLLSFMETLAENLHIMVIFNIVFAGIIAFGVVYNAARISLSERSRELASLRVLGFTRTEISLILLGELAILTLASLPVGMLLGYGLSWSIVASIDSEVYRLPLIVTPRTMAWSALTVVGAAILSGMVVRRRLDRLDLVGVLKTRE